MRVILWLPDYTRKDSVSYITTVAFSEGLTKLGIEHTVRHPRGFAEDPEIADVCVVNGWIKAFIEGRGHTNRNDIIRAQLAAGKPPWCIERGFVLSREEWSGISIGGFCSNGGDFRAKDMPPARWEKLGVPLLPWRADGDYVLLTAQVPWDAQVQDHDHLEWLEGAVRAIQAATDRPILFRGHPRAWRHGDPYGRLSTELREAVSHAALNKSPPTKIAVDLEGAYAVCCYNSNVATLATVAGVPVFTGAPCLADPIANRDWALLDDPPHPDRAQWAADLAYHQWHIDEFKEGLPWLHLTR